MEAGLKIFALRVRAKPEKVRVEVIVAGQPSFQKTVPFDLEVKEGERVSLRAFQEGFLDQTESLLATSDKTVELDLEPRKPGHRPRGHSRPEPRHGASMDPPPRPASMFTAGEGTLKPPL
jgi:hypothetical protein